MPFVFAYKSVEAKAQGGIWRGIRCEHCGDVYVFPFEMSLCCSETAPYGIGVAQAQATAESNAKRWLEHKLTQTVEPVPCPKCANYQEDMCQKLREQKFAWLNTLAYVFLSLGGAMVIMTGFFQVVEDWRNPPWKLILSAAGASVLVSLPLFWLHATSVRGHDPNADIPYQDRLAQAREHALTLQEFNSQHPGVELYYGEQTPGIQPVR